MPAHAKVPVIASREYIETVRDDRTMKTLSGLTCVTLDSEARVPDSILADAMLLVIEVAPDKTESLQRLAAIRRDHPDLIVLAAIRDANLSLVRGLLREGVADVVCLPFDSSELLPAILDALARRKETVALAPVLAVARSIGGCGATTIATHLAADLAAHDTSGRGVVILDLDLQFGSVADYLGVSSDVGIDSLLAAGNRIDDELVRSVAVRAAEGVYVVAAPETIMPLEKVDTEQLMLVIQHLRREFACVVLDLPADWTNWTLSAAIAADVILLVVELSIGSLRQAKRRLDLFRSVGVDDDAVQIVVNRVEKRLFRTIDLSDVRETLATPVAGSVSLEQPLVGNAQNLGQLVGQVQRKSRFATDIAQIGETLRNGRLGANA
ncbi:MAG: AAA family ATPase [Novosphingobium sp.]